MEDVTGDVFIGLEVGAEANKGKAGTSLQMETSVRADTTDSYFGPFHALF